MKGYLILFIPFFLCLSGFGQTYNLDNKYKITIPKNQDWLVSTHYCDTINNIYQYFQIRKDFKTTESKFSTITIKYEEPNNYIMGDLIKSDCSMGTITKIDTVKISKYLVRRRFGTNCNWLIEDWSNTKIAGYSVDMIVNLENQAYIRIMSSYYSSDEDDLNLIEKDLLSFLNNIGISQH